MLSLVDGAIKRKQTHHRSSSSAYVPHPMQPSNISSCQRMTERKSLLLPCLHHLSQAYISLSVRFFFPFPVRVCVADRSRVVPGYTPTDGSWLRLLLCWARASKSSRGPHMLALAWCCGSHHCAAILRSVLSTFVVSRGGGSVWKGYSALDLKKI